MPRRCPTWVVLIAASLHAFGIARSSLPAQDGLKFLRVARQFQAEPWSDVVRNSDQHPLYPASIAAIEPLVAGFLGEGPDSWRIAAQVVSAIASVLILFPLYSLARALFDDHPTATVAALLWALLPIPASIGRDTLADPLALLGAVWSLRLGELALRSRRLGPAIACAVASGLGYLARPEVALVPVVVALVAVVEPWIPRRAEWGPPFEKIGIDGRNPASKIRESPPMARFAAPAVAFLAIVGSYAMVKGEVSEKLSIRWGAGLRSPHDAARPIAHPLPDGLDGPGWDFSPKEESGRSTHLSLKKATLRVFNGWIEAMGWAFAVFAIWGAVRCRSNGGRALIAAFVAVFAAVLIRHATTLGYTSTRHTLAVVAATLPFAAAGALLCGKRLARLAGLSETATRRAAGAFLAALIVAGIVSQVDKAPHDARWGFGAAGRWLAENAKAGESVLDTRGWARFVSGRPGYDYWHVRQALTDARLAFVVVGAEELSAPSLRARSLRAILDHAGEVVASFPGRKGDRGADVLVYRFRRPESWEGLHP